MAKKNIDFREFDSLVMERAMADLGFNDRHIRIVNDLLRQGASAEDIVGRMLELFPTWIGRANALRNIARYLSAGRLGEE